MTPEPVPEPATEPVAGRDTLDGLAAELLRLAPGLDPGPATALLRRAYRAGRADGRRETVESREHGGW
ncbi:hypothetical protein HUT16_08370 [Kitasatospora sp. NA04385]|uniref:hypothetical protein n=1 Tax=Kitasatospora sp. NA04385 TaxID=2742135 RepID=UPI0015907533|nr:hypothetical protein [Kitasatospora sp. NA04385]QKW19075.1 hypothetical protein HUT16_08370 [Kitasatospora sp. NA04385]